MRSTVRVPVSEETQVGEARRVVGEITRRLGYEETLAGKASIVVTELAHNLVRHAGGGEMLIRELAGTQHPGLEFLALDCGPGMRNVGECMRDGFSTFGSAGNGLGSINRLADRLEIHSLAGRGTAVWARVCHPAQSSLNAKFEVGGVSVALEREDVCGDAWEIDLREGRFRLMLADGLGHGPFAEEAAREAINVFRSYPNESLQGLLLLVHQALGKTRGAAVAVGEISLQQGQVRGAGVGNIATRVVHHTGSKNLVSDNGTLGASFRRVLEFTHPWHSDSLLIMHSDGLGTQWNLDDYPGLASRHPSLIAGVLYRDYKRTRDDSTVVVARYSL